MAQEIKMSAAGLKAVQEELEYLKTVRRKELAEEIKEARSHGDLSENSEYDEAKNTQGLVENRITELEQTIKNAVIIDESELSVDNVSVGTHVTIRETGEDEAEEYDIVGRTEADAFNGKIQNSLGKTVWNAGGCNSWYLHPVSGRNCTVWPGFTWRYRWLTRNFDPAAYHFSRLRPAHPAQKFAIASQTITEVSA